MQANQLNLPANTSQQPHRKHMDTVKPSPKTILITDQQTNGNQQALIGVSQRYCRLVKFTNNKFENLEDARKLYHFEDAFLQFSKLCQSEADLQVLLHQNASFHKLVSSASIFAFLANAPDSKKYLDYLCIASAVDEWQDTLTSMNKIIFDGFGCLKHAVLLRSVYLLEFIICRNPNNLENIVINFIKEFNLGNCLGTTEEVIELLVVSLEMFIRQKEWFLKPPSNGNSTLISCVFTTYSRFLSDLPPGFDRCRSLLIYVIDFILRERFRDLILLGRDLLLILQRVSKFFPTYWKALIHNPQSLAPNFGGVPQLLASKCALHVVMNRIGFRLQFSLDRVMIYRPDVVFNLHCNWLTDDYLSGFDSCSLRSELIRFAINNQRYQIMNDQVKQCRNALLVHLISNPIKKSMPECQLAKLALVFDWLCSDSPKDAINSSGSQAQTLEAFFLVFRWLLDKQSEIGNSLLEMIIRTTLDFHPKFSTLLYTNVITSFRTLLKLNPNASQILIEHRQIDKHLRYVLSEFLPEIYGKPNLASANDANTLRGCSRIEELEAESKQILQQASNNPEVPNEPKSAKRKPRMSNTLDQELKQVKKALANEEVRKSLKSLDEVISALKAEFQEPVSNLRRAVESGTNDDAIDPIDEARDLMAFIKDLLPLVDKEQAKLLARCILDICAAYLSEKKFYSKSRGLINLTVAEQVNKPIFAIFESLYKSRSQKPSHRKSWLSVLRYMAKSNATIGYLYLFYLAANPGKNNRIEVSCYCELVESLKSSTKERLCQDMSMCAIECTSLFSFLLPYVFSSFAEANGLPGLIELICVTLDDRQAYNLTSQMHSRADITLFRKDTFSEIFQMSLKWNSHAQNIFWQFVRADNVSLDWVFDSLSVIKEQKHPTVSLNLLNMLQYMEIDITPSIVRGLFVKFSDDDLTLNLLNLIITDTDLQLQFAQKLAAQLKTFVKKENFYRPSPTNNKGSTQEKRAFADYFNLQTSFEHLERALAITSSKKGSLMQGLIKTEPLLKFYKFFKNDEEHFEEMQQNFHNLFTAWELAVNNESNKLNKFRKGRKPPVETTSDSRESRSKKARIDYEMSDENEDDD